jgi:predicted phosphodiesterase
MIGRGCVILLGLVLASCSDPGPEIEAARSEERGPIDAAASDADPIAPETTADETADGVLDAPPGDVDPIDGVPEIGDDGRTPPAGATSPNLKVAFVGDQGASANTLAVLELIKRERADFLIVLGDFDYKDDPALWDANLTKGLGADFPVFAAAGNHDVAKWPDYQKRLVDRLAKIPDAKCTGEYGVKMACTYRGLFFVLSGVGTIGSGHERYLEETLAADRSIFRVCAWHKNQRDMQVGTKGDEVGWGAYRICQNAGAMIMTGHEHSYARTKTLASLGDPGRAHGAFGEFDRLVLRSGAPGRTYVTVSGLGGVGIRAYDRALHDDDGWWATYYTSDRHVRSGKSLATAAGYGVTFVTFGVDGDPHKARGIFKNVAGIEIDGYELRRE